MIARARVLARLKKQFEWGGIEEREYVGKRNEIHRALAIESVIIDAARCLQSMANVWTCATAEERRDMVRAIFDEVVCDMDARRLTALRPKPAFRLLLRQARGLVERDGLFEISE